MRTQTLLLTAALGVAGAVSSFAQGTVYSVNAVGYVNQTYTAGFTLFSNPMDAGTGNNTVGKLITDAADGTTIYKFNGATYAINSFAKVDPQQPGEWDDPAMTLNPGEGAFILVPPNQTVKVTYVGEVMQGPLVNPIPKGFSIRSSQVPQDVDLSKPEVNFPAADGDTIYFWRPALQSYLIDSFAQVAPDPGAWDFAPLIKVGESVFISTAAAKDWTRNFSVNP